LQVEYVDGDVDEWVWPQMMSYAQDALPARSVDEIKEAKTAKRKKGQENAKDDHEKIRKAKEKRARYHARLKERQKEAALDPEGIGLELLKRKKEKIAAKYARKRA
jgi:hypothetical protein